MITSALRILCCVCSVGASVEECGRLDGFTTLFADVGWKVAACDLQACGQDRTLDCFGTGREVEEGREVGL